MPLRVRVEEMIRAGVILVHAALYEPHPENARIKIQVFLRWTRDSRDVMKSMDSMHRAKHRAIAGRALLQMVRFHQSDAGRAVHAADNGSVISGREIDDNRGFQFVRRREASARDGCLL